MASPVQVSFALQCHSILGFTCLAEAFYLVVHPRNASATAIEE
jgi:hypothetical protein